MLISARCRGAQILCAALVGFLLVVAISGCGEDNNSTSMAAPATSPGMAVRQTDLVSDVAGAAAMDPNLVNAWGIARGPTTPFWVADNHAGVSTLYDGAGHPFPVGQPLAVTIPPPAGSPEGTMAAPTGMVFNDTSDFLISAGSQSTPALFIFATEDGTVSAWNRDSGGTAILTADESGSDAIYKGLALGHNATGNFLYATDFHNGRVDVFDKMFVATTLSGSFVDPHIPAGFAPFGIANIDGSLFVTYAKQGENQEDDAKGPGNGFVDVFDTDGRLVRRFASQGPLNSPWGVVRAPAGFGSFGNAILVGNFGDGHINAFDPNSRQFLGAFTDGHDPISIDGLWGLSFGNGATAGDANTLFFTAGPGEEAHGLFGSLQPAT